MVIQNEASVGQNGPLHLPSQFTNPEAWSPLLNLNLPWLEEIVRLTLQETPFTFPSLEISFLFTDDASIHELNRMYREQDKATNVLSFPSYEPENLLQIFANPPLEPLPLGDLALALETIAREALASKTPFEHHLMHLIVHGVLHLLGYDHETDDEAAVMEALEIKILAYKSVPNPYESCNAIAHDGTLQTT